MDEVMMREAISLARAAAAEGEVPVGCVITLGDRIVGRAGTAGNWGNRPWPTRSSRPSPRHAGPWAAGGCGSVRST